MTGHRCRHDECLRKHYSPPRHYGRILALLRRYRRKEAETELRDYLEHVPENPIAHAQLAFCIGRNYDSFDGPDAEKRAEMLREAETAVAIEPENAFCHFVLASSYSLVGQFDKALKAAETAVRLEPDDAWNLYEKGFALYRLNRRRKARKTFWKVLELQADHYDALRLLVWVENDLGHKEAAIRCADEALNIVATDSEVYTAKGYAMLGVRPPEEVISIFQHALRMNPNDSWAQNGLIEAYKRCQYLPWLWDAFTRSFLRTSPWIRFLPAPLVVLFCFLFDNDILNDNRAEECFELLMPGAIFLAVMNLFLAPRSAFCPFLPWNRNSGASRRDYVALLSWLALGACWVGTIKNLHAENDVIFISYVFFSPILLFFTTCTALFFHGREIRALSISFLLGVSLILLVGCLVPQAAWLGYAIGPLLIVFLIVAKRMHEKKFPIVRDETVFP